MTRKSKRCIVYLCLFIVLGISRLLYPDPHGYFALSVFIIAGIIELRYVKRKSKEQSNTQ